MENDSTFVAPEGVYSIIEEHKPLIIQSHTTATAPVLYPTKISTVVVRYPPHKSGYNSQPFAQLLGGNKERELKKEKNSTTKDHEDGVSLSSSDTRDEYTPPDLSANNTTAANDSLLSTPATPHDHLNIFATHLPRGTATGKKKGRPKHNIRTTSSTFLTRVQSAEGLTKNLQSKEGESTYLFYNYTKSFIWTEVGNKVKEPLARLHFSAYPTCHDVHPTTVSPDHMDIIIGFNTGDLIWFDPISSRYCRLNKQGRISNSRCTAVRWVPSSQTLFLVSHADGTVIAYDKERDDGVFIAHEPGSSTSIPHSISDGSASSSDSSQKEWNPLDTVYVTLPPWHPVTIASGPPTTGGKTDKDKVAKNPVSHWRVSKRSIVDFVFSPDVKYVAAISEDGCLRVIDALAEQLVDCYASYFGALTAVAWSPDGRFILTGGQDDLVTIFSPWEQRVIARCQGHSSFISALSFDEVRCDGRTYRFGSVGEDNKLILWDFSNGALHRPKLSAHHQRLSMSSSLSLSFRRRGESIVHLPPNGIPSADGTLPPLPHYHPSPSRNEVAVVQPVLVKQFDTELLTDLHFLPSSLLTASKIGHIKSWIRPLVVAGRHKLKSKSVGVMGRKANGTNMQDVLG